MANNTRVDFNIGQITAEITKAADDVCQELAKQIATEAKATTLFKDETGRLRRSISVRKSRFGSGFLAIARAPHAHLVENGHIAQDGTFVAAKPFMRNSEDKVLTQANITRTATGVFKREGY